MKDEITLSKWAVGLGVSILMALGAQTFLAARWAGQVSERLDGVTISQQTIKREMQDSLSQTESRLNRRIERLEDATRITH